MRNIVYGHDITVNHIGSMFTLFFNPSEVKSFEDAKKSDQERFADFFRKMLANNIYISPSQFETNFISIAHTDQQLDNFLRTVKKVI